MNQMKENKRAACGLRRLEAGLLAMVTVLFLYAPAAGARDTEEAPEFRCRTLELVQEFAAWLETAFS